jgi:integrase
VLWLTVFRHSLIEREGGEMASLRKRGKKWYYRFTDADGIKRELKGCTDKRATEEMARATESAVAKVRAGLIDPRTIRHQEEGRRPIAEHVDDWHAALLAKGDTPKHAHMVRAHVTRIIALARIERVADLTDSRVQAALKAINESGRSLQTCNNAMRAVKGFSRWLHRDTRIAEDSLSHLKGFNIKLDQRHGRGVLSQAEFDALIRVTRPAKPYRGLSGDERAMLYLVAAYTGLRSSELASLTTASFDLDSERPTVRVRASATKNGSEAAIPLRPDLASMLSAFLDGRSADQVVWPGAWVRHSAEMLREDLDSAGVAYVDVNGLYRDFHSFRHRFGSELARANVPPKVAQELMRHSTITLTMDRYSHVGLHDTAAALAKLPPLPGTAPTTKPPPLDVTGTGEQHIDTRVAHSMPTTQGGSSRDLAVPGATANPRSSSPSRREPLELSGSDASGRGLGGEDGRDQGIVHASSHRIRWPIIEAGEARPARRTLDRDAPHAPPPALVVAGCEPEYVDDGRDRPVHHDPDVRGDPRRAPGDDWLGVRGAGSPGRRPRLERAVRGLPWLRGDVPLL